MAANILEGLCGNSLGRNSTNTDIIDAALSQTGTVLKNITNLESLRTSQHFESANPNAIHPEDVLEHMRDSQVKDP